MQTSSPATQPPPAAPPAPAPPPAAATPGAAAGGGATAGASVFEINPQALAVPRTEAEVSALRSRGSELSRQLQSAQRRRNEVVSDLRRADGANQAGLEQRLQLLDARILSIESDIAANGRLLAAAPPNLIASTEPPSPSRDNDLGPEVIVPLGGAFTMFVLAPIAFAYARRIWKRTGRPTVAPAQLTDQTQRMERMEQAVDAIAIEVERISENQRFLTRILTESRDAPALGVGQRPGEPAHAAREG